MRVSERLRNGANSLFRGGSEGPPGDQKTEVIYDWLRHGHEPSREDVGVVYGNTLILNSPDGPEHQST